jgi:hypothetical protein
MTPPRFDPEPAASMNEGAYEQRAYAMAVAEEVETLGRACERELVTAVRIRIGVARDRLGTVRVQSLCAALQRPQGRPRLEEGQYEEQQYE